MDLTITTTIRGGEKLCFLGYAYVIQKKCQNSIRWRCGKYTSYKCLGGLTTSLTKENPVAIKEHNHPSDRNGCSAMVALQKMKARAKDALAKPSQIFAEGVQNIPPAVRARIPTEEIVKRTLRNQVSEHSKNPNSLQELVIPDAWRTTQKDGTERLLLQDNRPISEERIIIFATDEGLKLLASESVWYMDGNFSLAPPLFLQLYVIRVLLACGSVTTVFCLMQRKTYESYKHMLQTIMAECEARDLFPDPSRVHMDFEKAAIQATKDILGDHVQIQGCFYHLCQSTHRKVQELGLEVQYRENEEFSLYVGMLDALAFLPMDSIRIGMEYLKSHELYPQYQQLVDYFDATYVTGTYRRIGPQHGNGNNICLRNMPPQFPPETWNVNLVTLLNADRTNNRTEGSNNRFANLVGQNHPTIWTLISKIRQEIAVDATKIEQHNLAPRHFCILLLLQLDFFAELQNLSL